MARAGGSLEIFFADGTPCVEFTSATIRESFMDPLGSYDFQAEPTTAHRQDYINKLKRGEPLLFRVDGNPLAEPIIQTVDTRIDSNGVTLNVSCHTLLVTPYEGATNPELSEKWTSDVSVDALVLQVMGLYGFDELDGDATAHVNALTGKGVSGRAAALNIASLKLKDIQANEGELAYALCSRVFNRLGAALHCDHTGKLLLRRPDYDQQALYTLVQDSTGATDGDRFLAGPGITIHDSNAGLYSEVVVRGNRPDTKGKVQAAPPIARVEVSDAAAQRPSGAPFQAAPSTQLATGPGRYSSTAAPYKPRYVLDKESRDAERCRNAARLIMGAGAANAYYVQGTVNGLVAKSGATWTTDTIARTVVESVGLDQDLWILERSFSVTKDGESTTMKLLPRGALELAT